MDYPEYKKRRLNNAERLAVMQIDMLQHSFNNAVNALSGRLAGVKGVKRDIGMLNYICRRLVKEALTAAPGVPCELAAHILKQSRDYQLRPERISPVKKMEECTMTLEDEWNFIHIALDSHCAICLKTGEECRKCKLRSILRKYTDEPEPGSMTECGYMGRDLADNKKINKQERI